MDFKVKVLKKIYIICNNFDIIYLIIVFFLKMRGVWL